MIKVLTNQELARKKTVCTSCGCTLEYDREDRFHESYYDCGLKLDIHKMCIICPWCKQKLIVREWAVDCL